MAKVKKDEIIVCTPKMLPEDLWLAAADVAAKENPANRPNLIGLPKDILTPLHIAVITSKMWGASGVKLGVSFLDSPNAATRKLILAHMNAWNQWANVTFSESTQGQVRIARANDGYWSYLGTDVLSIPPNQATMNLQGFTERTAESEYKRVVRHETGHTLGAPHEHQRKDIVARIDPVKATAYFRRYDGWDAQTVKEQVLTPLDERSLMSTPVDVESIMAYQLPGSIMKDGIAVPGGSDIDPSDGTFMASVYPKEVVVPPPTSGATVTFSAGLATGATGTYKVS